MLEGHPIEFFLEGTRSRSGKQLTPKLGMLGSVVEPFLEGKLRDVHLIPITIDYEKALEASLHQSEMLGGAKVKESLGALLNGSLSMLQQTRVADFGMVSVQIGDPISLTSYLPSGVPREVSQLPQGGGPAPGGLGEAHRLTLVSRLAHELTKQLQQQSRSMPSHLLASLLLQHRHGISEKELVEQMCWLCEQIQCRGGYVEGFEGKSAQAVLQRAERLLGSLVMRRAAVLRPNIRAHDHFGNMIELGYYRNHLMHHFFQEAICSCALYGLYNQGARCHPPEVLKQGAFLWGLLHQEFVYDASDARPLETKLHLMLKHGTFALDEDATPREEVLLHSQNLVATSAVAKDLAVEEADHAAALVGTSGQWSGDWNEAQILKVTTSGEALYALLCSMLWPFIDGYYVAVMSLSALRSGRPIEHSALLNRAQALGDRLYQRNLLSSYEACSLELLKNAMELLQQREVITIQDGYVRLVATFSEDGCLEALSKRISMFQQRTENTNIHARALVVAELPMLASL